jgi:hypothetical protein
MDVLIYVDKIIMVYPDLQHSDLCYFALTQYRNNILTLSVTNIKIIKLFTYTIRFVTE